jgi:hypothetical protein
MPVWLLESRAVACEEKRIIFAQTNSFARVLFSHRQPTAHPPHSRQHRRESQGGYDLRVSLATLRCRQAAPLGFGFVHGLLAELCFWFARTDLSRASPCAHSALPCPVITHVRYFLTFLTALFVGGRTGDVLGFADNDCSADCHWRCLIRALAPYSQEAHTDFMYCSFIQHNVQAAFRFALVGI